MSVTIFVPGIKGTELYEGDNKRWFPATARDLEALSLENELEPREILSKVNAFFFCLNPCIKVLSIVLLMKIIFSLYV